jgi:transcriptional regulator with XRE-family HTH domain
VVFWALYGFKVALRAITVESKGLPLLQNFFEGISSCPTMGRPSTRRFSAFGQQLAVWIVAAGFQSRLEFAKAIGMTGSNLSRLMRQKEAPGEEKLATFAAVLGLPLEEVLAVAHLRVDKNFHERKLNPSPTILSSEGSPMREHIDQILGALGQVPTRHRQEFADAVSDIAARFRLGLTSGSAQGAPPGKRRRRSGTG